MDKKSFNHMWERQKLFNRNFIDFENLDFDKKQTMTKEYVLHMLSEANSLLDEVNWKLHHKKDIPVNRRDLVYEVIDVWKYLLSICLVWDISPSEFCSAFDDKSALVEQRYLQEFSQIENRKVVICDIDGVLSDYPESFLKYVEEEERLLHNDFHATSECTNLDLYQLLEGQVPSSLLKEYKHRYRSGGLIKQEKVNEDTREFLHRCKDKGYYLVLLTSRPFDTYKCLFVDTYSWLVDNGIEFDMLLHDSKKRDKVSKILETSDIEVIIDDDPRLVNNLKGLDKLNKILLVDRPYNQEYECSGKVERVKSLSEYLNKLDTTMSGD